MRGVILGPRLERASERGLPTTVYPDPMLLRQCVLYWDMIDWPRYSMTGGFPAEAKYLQEEGVLISTTFEQPILKADEKPQGGDVLMWTVNPRTKQESARRLSRAEHFVIPQALAFAKNNADGTGLWSLAQSNPYLVLPASHMDRTIEVELYRAVPVPSPDTPIERVLEFKRGRSEQLRAFRRAVDDLYLEIIRSPDLPFAKLSKIEELQQHLIDLHRVMSEARINRVWSTARIEFNPVDMWDAVVRAGALGAAGSAFGFTAAALGAAVGLASGAIKLRPQQVPRLPDIPRELSAYAYLASIEAELGTSGRPAAR